MYGETTDLHRERFDAVIEMLRWSGARSIADLGCGEGELLLRCAAELEVERLAGMEADPARLAVLKTALAQQPAGAVEIALFGGSLLEPEPALAGYDAVLLVEVIEHVDPDRLSAVETAVFARMRPGLVIVTTPNVEYNPVLGVPPHRFRHPDHRFEWDRAKFRSWAEGVAARQGYRAGFADIAGRATPEGRSTQMAVFRRPGSGGAG